MIGAGAELLGSGRRSAPAGTAGVSGTAAATPVDNGQAASGSGLAVVTARADLSGALGAAGGEPAVGAREAPLEAWAGEGDALRALEKGDSGGRRRTTAFSRPPRALPRRRRCLPRCHRCGWVQLCAGGEERRRSAVVGGPRRASSGGRVGATEGCAGGVRRGTDPPGRVAVGYLRRHFCVGRHPHAHLRRHRQGWSPRLGYPARPTLGVRSSVAGGQEKDPFPFGWPPGVGATTRRDKQ